MIFPKELNYSFFENLLREQDEVEICCVVVDSESEAAEWRAHVGSGAIARWDELTDPASESTANELHARCYQKVLTSMTADPRTFYILERHYRSLDKEIIFNSVFNRTIELEVIVWNTLALIHRTQPDRIVHYNIPHGKLWLIAKIAELLGVEVVASAISPLPWKEWIVSGMETQRPIAVVQPVAKTDRLRVAAFVDMLRGNYNKAMPSYEKERFDYFKGGFFSPKKELRTLASVTLRGRSLFLTLISALISVRKFKVLKQYAQLTANFEMPEKYVIFFLHYQPERTTLPEGGGFAQQWLALRAISEALPTGHTLLVKEHPSTFRYYYHPGFRSMEFHTQISRLPNTRLAPLALSSYELIDRAVAVATVTGTVGIEALVRGKPVLVFGAAQYRGQDGVYAVDSIEAVRAALKKISTGAPVLDAVALESFLNQVDGMSYAIWEGNWPGVLTPDLIIAAREVMHAAMFADLTVDSTLTTRSV